MSEIVKVTQGDLRGFECVTDEGTKYYSYLGIPYAEPPLQKLRFKYPVPKKAWKGIRDALIESSPSAQIRPVDDKFIGSEDCLYLNVFVPKIDVGSNSLPVMVHFHGGGFTNWYSSVSVFGPQYFMETNVILVTFNFRLGVMGFLCTDAINARGDMGLMDQRMALKWIKENIASFGGDPWKVTLFGHSSGAAAIEHHLLARKSHQYFHRAIIESGSAISEWAMSRNPFKFSIKLGKALGYEREDTECLFDFLNKFDIETLLKHSANLVKDEDEVFPFIPVVNYFKDGKGFQTEDPLEIIRTGTFYKIPILSGVCGHEGMLVDTYASQILKNNMNEGSFIKMIYPFLDKTIVHLDRILRRIYAKKPCEQNSNQNIIDFYGDYVFEGSMAYSLQQRLKYNPNSNYVYKFIYDGNMNYTKRFLNISGKGACHGDELGYLGTLETLPKEIVNEMDVLTRKRLTTMWSNFGKFGNPTPKKDDLIEVKWLPSSLDRNEYLEIGEELKMREDFLKTDRRILWIRLHNT